MSFTKEQLVPGEQVVASVRMHVLTLLRPFILLALSLVIIGALAVKVQVYWILLFLLVPAAYLLWEWMVRQRTEYVVTNRRIVRQEGVFSVSSFDAPLDKINNVFHTQSFLGRIFRYGSVGLETASEQGTTVFDMIPDPVGFKNIIVRQRELDRPGGARGQVDTGADVPKLLEELASLRDRGIITAEEFASKKQSLLGRL